MYGQKIPPIYRTSSPTENTDPTNWKITVKQGKGTADHLMPLSDCFQYFTMAKRGPAEPPEPTAAFCAFMGIRYCSYYKICGLTTFTVSHFREII